MSGEPVTFVTITYRAEDSLLRLQARSFAKHLPADVVSEIIVIDNGLPALSRRKADRLRREYGPLAPKVTVVRTAEIADTAGMSGWTGQQVLKLGIARRVRTPWYVLLDAKNHAIRDLSSEDLVAPDGRARGGFHSYTDHPLRPHLMKTLDYLGIDESAAQWYPPTSTPFVMNTDTAREILEGLPAPFEKTFREAGLSEFFLYSGWILRRDGDWDDVYDGVAIQCPTLWGGSASAAGIRREIERAIEIDAPFFGVHRRALRRIRSSDFGPLARFWVDRGLVRSVRDARALRRAFLREHAVAAVRARLR